MPSTVQDFDRQAPSPAPLVVCGRSEHREHATVEAIRRMRDPALPMQERRRMRDHAVRLNLSYAQHFAYGYRNRGESLDDLLQVAALALVKAVDGFDSGRGRSFTGYATPTILGELKRHFRDRVWGLHVPRGMKERSLAVTRARADLTQRLQRAPTAGDIGAALDLSEGQVRAAEASAAAYRADSINRPACSDSDSCEVQELLGAPDDDLEAVGERAMLRAHLDQLPPRARFVMDRYFYGNRTQAQIAEEIGVSQMSVSRSLSSSLEALRDMLAEPPEQPANTPAPDEPRSFCRVSRTDQGYVVAPSGPALEESGVAAVRNILLDVAGRNRPRTMLVDLRHVRRAHPSIIRALLDAYRAGVATGSRLVAVNLAPDLHRMLDHASVTRLFVCRMRTAPPGNDVAAAQSPPSPVTARTPDAHNHTGTDGPPAAATAQLSHLAVRSTAASASVPSRTGPLNRRTVVHRQTSRCRPTGAPSPSAGRATPWLTRAKSWSQHHLPSAWRRPDALTVRRPRRRPPARPRPPPGNR